MSVSKLYKVEWNTCWQNNSYTSNHEFRNLCVVSKKIQRFFQFANKMASPVSFSSTNKLGQVPGYVFLPQNSTKPTIGVVVLQEWFALCRILESILLS